jgi:hypothetical protein
MLSRPWYVTAAGILLIWWSVLTGWKLLAIITLTAENNLWLTLITQTALNVVILVVSGAIELAGGICMLRGVNWARLLWSFWSVFHIFLSLLLSMDANLNFPILILQFLIILGLFLPRANSYFMRP